jgi:hypothetical protein
MSLRTAKSRWVLPVLGMSLLVVDSTSRAEYKVVDTAQESCFDATTTAACPSPGEPFDGQDAQHHGHRPGYLVSADGTTVQDLRTGLTWQKSPDLDGDGDIDADDKRAWSEALALAASFNAAGYGGFDDWRLPGIKELYSLILFNGIDPSGYVGNDPSLLVPFLDTDHFDFSYGDTAAGERLIDAQFWSSTEYVSTTMFGDATAFGVNFADGRIKGYPTEPIGPPGDQTTKTAFVRLVRGNPTYGINEFVAGGDGTVTDVATGLVWQQGDSIVPLNWEDALNYCQELTTAGCEDWRLPDAKELQSIVDYTRSPDTTGSAAIDPVFDVTAIVDEDGGTNYPFYWSSTTHQNWTVQPGAWGAYLCFGEALGWMQPPTGGAYVLLDVHGAGSQRSDPKQGDPGDYPLGHGPQGDVVRIFNHVRCVRGAPVPACEVRVSGRAPTILEMHPTCPQPSLAVVTGLVSELRADGGFGRSTCLGSFVGEASDAGAIPSAGQARFYLARGIHPACAAHGYGQAEGIAPDPRAELLILDPCP